MFISEKRLEEIKETAKSIGALEKRAEFSAEREKMGLELKKMRDDVALTESWCRAKIIKAFTDGYCAGIEAEKRTRTHCSTCNHSTQTKGKDGNKEYFCGKFEEPVPADFYCGYSMPRVSAECKCPKCPVADRK